MSRSIWPLLFGLFPALLAAAPADGLSVLHQRCIQCHASKTAMSGLAVDSREALVKGGTRGPALKPGDAAGSLLYKAVAHTAEPHMPPTGKLAGRRDSALREWIDAGAEWSVSQAPAAAGSDWWAFRNPEKPAVPAGATHPVDAFLARKLAAEGLSTAPEADRATLIRRASFDLTGLPPSYEDVQAFVQDKDPQAYEKLIDRLLASKHYGEKWGRHWLDLVRYGDTSGFEQDPYTLEAYRYRDYVIRSFNDDKPYDRFVKEQIAADEIYPEEPEARVGTGYYRVNANRDMLFKVEDLNRVEKLTDYVDTTSKVFLALSVGCARCHDHKFDPIPQKDFYRMQAIFAPAVNDDVFLEYNSARFYSLAWNTRDFKLRNIADQIKTIFGDYGKKLRNEKLQAAENPQEVIDAYDTAKDERTPRQEELVTEYEDLAKVGNDEIYAALSQEDQERIDAIEKRLVGLFKNYGPPPMAPGVIDVGRESPRTYIALRGNPEAPGDEVGPGYLTALGGGDIPDPPLHAPTTFRRKHLAEWIASPDNPLTARVMVNRMWQLHFGEGLVGTPSDFGLRAGKPSHPELLDWLAVTFVEKGWSMKAMHRLLMTSDAYKRSSVESDSARTKDPENRLLRTSTVAG
ncbi:MAG: PSD1 and planctomycete cytochrome C domain-containing protein [Bryobacterales bacterium]